MKTFTTLAATAALTLGAAAPALADTSDPFAKADKPVVSSQAVPTVPVWAIIGGVATVVAVAASDDT
ncbi:hypothetical protein DRV84_05915 [Rhodosalinus sediminis]|jgi:uncharacterized low-complexity protein|uniref:Ferrochelatase n=1 Tax=Rhodosalinus sediminis TaxID=1940533 RepID=A0A3D9BW13_9RHOB|nr:hypothetical protein [Rhodosalinus sediminis]REC57707.1 hypothetical protein DRV84_05915 [Rhodosalinus sediminis]